MSDDAPNTKLDSVEQFATDLRDLRLQAGNPTLGALHTRTQISKSVLSEALSGRKLPTERTVASLAEALGADRGMWIARRNALDPRTPPLAGSQLNSRAPVGGRLDDFRSLRWWWPVP